MGGSASKTARRLPSAAPSRPPPPPSALPPITPAYSSAIPPSARPSTPAAGPSTQYDKQEAMSAAARSTDPRRQVSETGPMMASMGAADITGKSKTGFSGKKDAALLRDAQDPHFMANLSKLGPVRVQNAGQFTRTTPQAQRTLAARTPSLSSDDSAPPPGYTDAATLVEVLDALKSVRTQSSAEELYRRHRLEPAKVDSLRRWVNSISVGREVLLTEEGREVLKRTAVWVDGPTAPTAR